MQVISQDSLCLLLKSEVKEDLFPFPNPPSFTILRTYSLFTIYVHHFLKNIYFDPFILFVVEILHFLFKFELLLLLLL